MRVDVNLSISLLDNCGLLGANFLSDTISLSVFISYRSWFKIKTPSQRRSISSAMFYFAWTLLVSQLLIHDFCAKTFSSHIFSLVGFVKFKIGNGPCQLTSPAEINCNKTQRAVRPQLPTPPGLEVPLLFWEMPRACSTGLIHILNMSKA